MNRLHLILLLLIAGSQARAQELSLKYRFSYDTSFAKPQLKVNLSFKGNNSGKTVLQLPDRWASQQELYKSITSFNVTSKGVTIDSSNGPSKRTLTHKPGQSIEIEYILTQDWQGQFTYPKNYRAVIDKKYFQLTGYALFIYPETDPSTITNIQFDWKDMPKGWSVGNSFHSGSRQYKGSTMWGNIQNSIFIGGDFRLYATAINKETIHLAIRGNDWKFKDSAMAHLVNDIISRERDFWNDHTQPYYFVSLVPFESKGQLNGSSLHNSFFLGMTPEFALDMNVQYLLSHEYFHRWIGGNGKLSLAAAREEEGYWFSEGFTDYYTYKFLHSTGMISRKQYIDMANKRLAEYYLSPLREKDNKTLAENFWTTRDYQMMPYRKGFTYALYLDWLLQSSTKKATNLDRFLFESLAYTKIGKFDEPYFIGSMEKLSGKSIDSVHNEWIIKGKLIQLDSTTASIIDDSLVVRPQQMGAYDIGFDYEASAKAKKITGLRENSSAWQAGLREGQTVKGWSMQFDNINIPAVITILDENGKEKKISYSPQSPEKFSVPQIVWR